MNNDYVKDKKHLSVLTIQILKMKNVTKVKCFETKTPEQDINHTEEVIIGTEQGTTFPTKIGTSTCNALIDTGATKSCISENTISTYPQLKFII